MDFCLAVFPKRLNVSIAEGRSLQWTNETRTFSLVSSSGCSWKKRWTELMLCHPSPFLSHHHLLTSTKDQYFLSEPRVPVSFRHTRAVVGIDSYLDRKFIVLQWLNNKHALFIKETVTCLFFSWLPKPKACLWSWPRWPFSFFERIMFARWGICSQTMPLLLPKLSSFAIAVLVLLYTFILLPKSADFIPEYKRASHPGKIRGIISTCKWIPGILLKNLDIIKYKNCSCYLLSLDCFCIARMGQYTFIHLRFKGKVSILCILSSLFTLWTHSSGLLPFK